MKVIKSNIINSLSKAYQKQSLKRAEIELFKNELKKVFNYFDNEQDEDYHKNIVSDFLKNVYYKDKYLINVNKRQDLAIRNGNSPKDSVGVLLEFKKPAEKRDMFSTDHPNTKSFQQIKNFYDLYKFFTEPKILIVRTRNLSLKQRIVATIDKDKKYNLNRLSNIIARNRFSIYGLLGILNSELFNWLYSTRYIDYEIKPVYLRNSPMADVNNAELIKLVKSVIKDKQKNKDTTKTENEIDDLVYKLYNISYIEIEMIKEQLK